MMLLVTGGRDYRNREKVWEALDNLYRRYPDMEIVQGFARGADWLARCWAREMGVKCYSEKAKWRVYGNAAGPIRNQLMIDKYKPDQGLVFPGGTGTEDMVRRLVSHHIPFDRIV